MTIYERSETYVHDIEFINDSGSHYDPDEVKITIKSPCDTVLVDDTTMTKTDTGIYTYSYTLLDTAIYGQYSVSVKSTEGTDVAIESDKFFVMPWNITDEVRTYSQKTIKKISDDDLCLIVWNAFREVSHRVMELQYREKLCCCMDGICSCSNKIECNCCCGDSSPICSDGYSLNHAPIADFNNDKNVHGCECDDSADECHNDICIIWKDNDSVCHNGAVEVVNAECGAIKVFKSDCSTPIPSDNKGIFVTYHSTWESYNLQMFKKAVVLLATYELAIQTNLTSKKVAGCDERGRVSFTDKIWNRYLTIIESISKPMIGGGK